MTVMLATIAGFAPLAASPSFPDCNASTIAELIDPVTKAAPLVPSTSDPAT